MYHRFWTTLCLVALILSAGLLSSRLHAAQPPLAREAQPFSQQWLRTQARQLAERPFQAQSLAPDSPLRSLDYDAYRRIVFDPEAAVWSGEQRGFTLNLFHPGYLYNRPVDIHLVNDGEARRLKFTTQVFDYHEGLKDLARAAASGYAGFRVHHPINSRERLEEFLLFLGASYFRAVGSEQVYGLSARGLAINTVGPEPEEFPRFSDFWIERPGPECEAIVIHALLDGPSVTGAYRFTAVPGERTRIEVTATLYPRRELAHVGIAPLTSMFLFDATNSGRFDDFRPAVHDSEGLQIRQANGERVWRPLANPRELQVSAFQGPTPAGFGLLQRHRHFERFNDNEARYDKRPSLWIEPLGDWGEGHVELVEIPTETEASDNIVAYWQPATALQAGNQYRFRYRMHWGGEAPHAPEQGRIVETAAGSVPESRERLFVIDYSDGRSIPDMHSNTDAVRIHATTSAGSITSVSGTLVEATGNYRAYVRLDPQEAELAELRVTLEVSGQQWGETWLYRWTAR